MKRTWMAVALALTVALPLAACGGGGAEPDAAGGADASVDAGPVITGNTAKGVYPVAEQLVKAVMPDATLYTIQGQRIDANGEVDPSTNQSWWRFTFVDLGLGRVTYAFWTAGEFTITGPNPMNTETLKVFTTDWIDSGEAMAKITAAGFVATDPADQYARTDGILAVFVGDPMDFRSSIPEPLWHLSKVLYPPGQTPTSESWWTTYWAGNMPPGYLVCDPAGNCTVGP